MRELPIFILLLPLASLVLAQDDGAQKRFAGTWEAKFHNKVICTIKLEAANPPSGAMHACTINVNGEGELIEPETADDRTNPILNPKLQGDTLRFAVKDEDSEQPMKFELKLSGDAQAELRFVSAPVAIKPIRFEKK
jgi:hypothetical protein